ncbi:DNA polymerase epsilon, subunit B [Violaceomyces palustris]|uniref:DNA polymerase epsilon, subunit B n=1 Tax=Violaceomyces palustris TaxID=1673888 RepID=A0ACD0P2H9_9BASI|nr:DNA polymerase epsilon, subunit B [Violaceomyces palustris]
MADPSSSAIQPPPALRKSILKVFTKKYSLQLDSSAISFIAQTLDSHGLLDQPDEWEDAIEALAGGIVEAEATGGKLSLSGSVVTQAALEKVYAQLVVEDSAAGTETAESRQDPQSHNYLHHHHDITDGERPNPEKYFNVVDAFKMPRVVFDQKRKVFEKSNVPPTILPMASSRPAYLRERLGILKNIVLRNENFLPPLAVGEGRRRDAFMKLTSTKNLLGRQGQRFLLFGMLSTSHDGQYVLEDADGVVGLDLEEAIPGEGIFTEGSFILVEGEYTEEERMRVFAIGHPPSESRREARLLCGHVDFLGTGAITLKDEDAFRVHEKAHDELCMVVISDLHLDHAKTMSNFRAILQGYVDAEFIPFAFILCGDFSSSPWSGSDVVKKYQDSFVQLADLIGSFPEVVKKSHFVIVPGPSDPFASPTVPRPALAEVFTAPLKRKMGDRVHLASNPCRITYLGQEIVVYRDDLMARMLRNTVSLKDEVREGDLKKFLVSTLLDQAHLCPLPQQVRPILWEFDHSLRLYPMPTALVLADKYDRFELTYEGCNVFNPGSFRGSSYGWTTYYPATGKAERSELPQ